jgi:hypothetical protein
MIKEYTKEEVRRIVEFAITAEREACAKLCDAECKMEQEPVGNTITFITRAIFNVVARHQEINGGYFISDGDIDNFVEKLAKVINSTFEPLKPKNITLKDKNEKR